jgi:hypothetical protein
MPTTVEKMACSPSARCVIRAQLNFQTVYDDNKIVIIIVRYIIERSRYQDGIVIIIVRYIIERSRYQDGAEYVI